MESLVLTLLFVIGVILVIAIMMQPSKQQDALSSLSGGGGELFAQQKSRGFEVIIRRFTAVTGIIWMLLALLLMYLTNH
ncbi:MAG: preprotein translocase subunit SecG [Lactobacillaceae bacterium]|jgi:preprotein translocase subunit SecG|nr:preprotein translocase subunit SecG [Lactobacillaceae bacterium]